MIVLCIWDLRGYRTDSVELGARVVVGDSAIVDWPLAAGGVLLVPGATGGLPGVGMGEKTSMISIGGIDWISVWKLLYNSLRNLSTLSWSVL